MINIKLKARELVNDVPSEKPLESSTTQVTITIRDVNDSPPDFNRKEFAISLPENTPKDTPLALDMTVMDRDVGINSKFSLRLEDVSHAFRVEPNFVTGYSQVNIRVANGSLDYENPNQRKFIVLVIAEETDTNPKLSSTATITVAILDVNDNIPIFEEEAYTANVPEDAPPGHYITTITARDFDSGNFGDEGIRYSISGNGAELLQVNERTGVVTLADCHQKDTVNHQIYQRQINEQNVLLSNDSLELTNDMSNSNDNTIRPDINLEYEFIKTTEYDEDSNYNYKEQDDITGMITSLPKFSDYQKLKTCLDFETESTYFLNYKVITYIYSTMELIIL